MPDTPTPGEAPEQRDQDESKPGARPRSDADWKAEARVEKERLAREAGDAAAKAKARPREVPPAGFAGLVHSLAARAMMFLSDRTHPETGESLQDLELAKHTIDLLAVLEEKTRGNLDEEERRLLDGVLYELRMAYVSAAS